MNIKRGERTRTKRRVRHTWQAEFRIQGPFDPDARTPYLAQHSITYLSCQTITDQKLEETLFNWILFHNKRISMQFR